MTGLDLGEVERVVYTALAEDLGDPPRDVTSEATIPGGQVDTAELVARAPGVVAGLPVAAQVFAATSGGMATFDQLIADGPRVVRGDVLAVITGPTRSLLTAERTALNLLCRMSGVATHTRKWADALADTKATVLDTRKTTPGLRALEKYAVRVGGGTNKRMGLYDVAMIKDNHKLAAGGITSSVQLAAGLHRRVGLLLSPAPGDRCLRAASAPERSRDGRRPSEHSRARSDP